jgi:hypothetical protein
MNDEPILLTIDAILMDRRPCGVQGLVDISFTHACHKENMYDEEDLDLKA